MSEFDDAFLALQRSFKPLRRNAVGDDGKPYADIEAIWTYIRPRLAKHGFVLFQSEGADTVTTVIRKGADYIRFEAKTEPSSSGPNRYGRRHALMCLLGLVEEPLPQKTLTEAFATSRAESERDAINAALGGRGDLDGEAAFKLQSALATSGASPAQWLVIARSGKSVDDMVAEAQRLGGAK